MLPENPVHLDVGVGLPIENLLEVYAHLARFSKYYFCQGSNVQNKGEKP